ncbi:MAG TPA: DNA methyltransferase, partial [Verrucomicrobiae bacterium]
MPKRDVDDFISHWKGATAPEQSISQQFLCELCDLLDVPQPGNQRNGSYTFEFHVSETQHDGTTKEGRIDLYKRASFILESKKFQEKIVEQTSLELAAEQMGAVARRKKIAAPVRDTDRWDDAMLKAFVQARDYVRALPTSEPAPPFLLVVDVGHVIEVRADFSLTGRAYQPFPDPLTYRIPLKNLRDEKIRNQLKLIWTSPLELDPSKRSAEVTREVAKHLAELAKSFEKKHSPKVVAEFLTRCLFCMFAEDVGLLPNGDGKPGFTELLNSLPTSGEGFETMLRTLFAEMNEGRGKGNEVSVILRRKLLKFNGGLFADNTVLPVNGTQLGILKAAAALDWQHVEPAIFGTLLERALGGEGERHKLGAHFTPRAYVERLVMATIIEPLRAEWENVRAAAVQLGKRGKIDKAREIINQFHRRLCDLKVLDPACGSGNFLYVTLENLKRLEGEVLDFAGQFGESFKLEMGTAHTVDPHQFLGLEINPRAAALAELVLWIGYLQWHFRTRGQTMPAEPVLKNFKNIQCRDAVLAYDGEPQPALDAAGNAKSVWNRLGKKTDTVTGREVPDETKRVPLLTYTNPRQAIWPEADFIVGNPPFIGDK